MSHAARQSAKRLLVTCGVCKKQFRAAAALRFKSSSLSQYTEDPPHHNRQDDNRESSPHFQYPFDEQGNLNAVEEMIDFPAVDRQNPEYNMETKPVLLNSKEHAIGYLSRILNARVYEAAIETDLQHAKNLSAVRIMICL